MDKSVYRVVKLNNVMDYLIESPDDCEAFISACWYGERYYVIDGTPRFVQKQLNNGDWKTLRRFPDHG